MKLNMHHIRRQKAILKLDISVPSSPPLSRPHKGHCVSRPFLVVNLSPCLPTSFPAWAASVLLAVTRSHSILTESLFY